MGNVCLDSKFFPSKLRQSYRKKAAVWVRSRKYRELNWVEDWKPPIPKIWTLSVRIVKGSKILPSVRWSMPHWTCAVCGQASTATCAGCRGISYCSREHQRTDWKAHKPNCRPLSTQSTGASSEGKRAGEGRAPSVLPQSQTKAGQASAAFSTISEQGTGYSFESIGRALQKKHFKNIIVMTGAGISVSAGIPDFRSPGTGLYDNLQQYDLPQAEAIFDIEFFRYKPKAFNTLAKELYPGNFDPTPAHFFIKMLADQGVLLRNYSQNIDGLELQAGLPKDLLVQAHGGFQTAHCIDCYREFPSEWVRERVMADGIPRCESNEFTGSRPGCGGLVKPDIVFFGENLPDRFHRLIREDFPKCDLLIVMGTSLQVQPFAGLVHRVGQHVPRLLINLEKVGAWEEDEDVDEGLLRRLQNLGVSSGHPQMAQIFSRRSKKSGGAKRDVFFQGTTDQGASLLAEAMGLGLQLSAMSKQAAQTNSEETVVEGKTKMQEKSKESSKVGKTVEDKTKSKKKSKKSSKRERESNGKAQDQSQNEQQEALLSSAI
eukprot:g65123.t1